MSASFVVDNNYRRNSSSGDESRHRDRRRSRDRSSRRSTNYRSGGGGGGGAIQLMRVHSPDRKENRSRRRSRSRSRSYERKRARRSFTPENKRQTSKSKYDDNYEEFEKRRRSLMPQKAQPAPHSPGGGAHSDSRSDSLERTNRSSGKKSKKSKKNKKEKKKKKSKKREKTPDNAKRGNSPGTPPLEEHKEDNNGNDQETKVKIKPTRHANAKALATGRGLINSDPAAARGEAAPAKNERAAATRVPSAWGRLGLVVG